MHEEDLEVVAALRPQRQRRPGCDHRDHRRPDGRQQRRRVVVRLGIARITSDRPQAREQICRRFPIIHSDGIEKAPDEVGRLIRLRLSQVARLGFLGSGEARHVAIECKNTLSEQADEGG